ncbi:TIGR04500 family putative peptide maturation system protein [Micromonospora aurantiaca (nom. illeg.)]|uniref:TIGR04500 family putative peptide maturation system protein n=1 Tax=Micromonospora aurantiaca (nom. illeg.) TaxID=47850 RepID=UPI0033DBECF1
MTTFAPSMRAAEISGGSTPETELGADLVSAVALLRQLPRHRNQVGQARQAVADWAAAHSRFQPGLVIDAPPGDLRVSYDLVLAHPEGGSIAITGQTEDGTPWSIEYSTHFASNQLLSVNERPLTVPTALFTLRALNRRDPTLHKQLIDHCLLYDEVFEDVEEVTTEELTAAATKFRVGRGLYSRAATLEWLADIGLSERTFAVHIELIARIERFRHRFIAEHAADYLRAHPTDFDRVNAVWVQAADPKALNAFAMATTPAELFTSLAQLSGETETSGEVQLTTGRRWALDLPAPLRSLPAGEVTGPVQHEGQVIVGAVRGREANTAANPDALARAGQAALDTWLTEQRAKATIRWHWL